MFLMSAVFI